MSLIFAKGMVNPTIVQDAELKKLLMLAYHEPPIMGNDGCRQARPTYWSRSRQELWVKGETSGHFSYSKPFLLIAITIQSYCR